MSSIKSTSVQLYSYEKKDLENNLFTDTPTLLKAIISDEQCIPVVIVIITIWLYPLFFSFLHLIWLQLVISYISQSAFQQPLEKEDLSSWMEEDILFSA